MPLVGGPSDKLGNRYELWWTVSRLIRIIDGEAKSICIEELSVDKAEFVLKVADHQELHQAKRSHQRGNWSLHSLQNEGLLQAMFGQLRSEPHRRFVFVSGSESRELRELTERARDAECSERFQTLFIKDKTNKDRFEKIKEFWCETDDARAYDVLRRIEVRTTDERGLQEHVYECLKARFLTKPDTVSDALRSLAEDSIHKTINRDMLNSYLKNKGFRSRKLSKSDDAPALVDEVTDRFLHDARRLLIQDPLIPRSTTRELLVRINDQANGAAECILTGKAGGGKTGSVIECVEALRQQPHRVMVLAFRLGAEQVSSTKELGEILGLEESPVLVLAAAAETESIEAVLLIDQLDAVSTTSGRNSDFLDVVTDLASEARSVPNRVKMHIVIVCREFDWDNDHRLRHLLAKDAARFTITDFPADEVREVLMASGFQTDKFDANQLELLRLPQNLKLFLDAHPGPTSQPVFSSPKELFDLYWQEKRSEVNQRAYPSTDCWNHVIQALCHEMTTTQQLFVLREKLDNFPDTYLHQMVSEGVLSFSDERYGFGHESFFDYCFARGFVAREETLTEFLKASEQHLFRRAQVRQVLAYLRDADHVRYCQELYALLADQNIRPHLKDLALAWVCSLPDPQEGEWEVLAPWIESELEAVKNGSPNLDKLASLAWNRFFASQFWFEVADRKGLVADWLMSDCDRLADLGVQYVRVHQRHSGDRVAELLEPFVGRDGNWPQRLSFIMQRAQLDLSRRLFELFLRFIDEGTLDDTRGLIAVNSTFWSILHNLETRHPDWIAEVLAHWLLRRLAIVRQTKNDADQLKWHKLFNYDRVGPEIIKSSAYRAPEAFARHVLPAVIEIADEASHSDNSLAPKRDAVWSILLWDDHLSMKQACVNAIVAAVEQLAENKPESIKRGLGNLRQQNTYTANFILLHAYAAGASHFADEAVSVLCNEPWRFECGYSNSPIWVAMQLVGAVVRHCTDDNRKKLEQAILVHIPLYKRSQYGHKDMGRHSYGLLSRIPAELRSDHAQARFMELERKFGSPESPPERMQAYRVGSPIQEAAAEKMTDEQWLKAIAKYDTEESKNRWEHPEQGGALQLARTLEEFVKQDPERFARLSLRFPSGTHLDYMKHTLRGLKGAKGDLELKLKVCRKAYHDSREEFGMAIADLLGSIEDALPQDAVQMLNWLANRHPDPNQELWNEQATESTPYFGGDILTHGINTTRGRAAEAIKGSYPARCILHPTILDHRRTACN